MKTSPSGLQVTFLLFAITFGAMLATRPLANAIGLPEGFFNTLGNLVAFPLELAFILCIPSLRGLVMEGFRYPLPVRARFEAMALSLLKVSLVFGLWGAIGLWGLHVSQRSTDLQAYGFLLDREAMDARYFATWGLINAALAVSFGPFCEEVIFRGVLYRLWERQWGWGAGALLSALVFSLIHPRNLIPTFLSAILYACLYRRTGSLWATTLCHAFFNLLVTWPLLGHVLQVKPPEAAMTLGPWIPNLVCLALGAMGFLWYVRLAARTPAPH
jgi:membrane protease YdiL (CAAX protease family)